MKVLLCVALLCIPAVAECPYSVACPYDGEQMQNTWNCKGVGEQRACQFRHSKWEDGKQVVHTTWASCPS